MNKWLKNPITVVFLALGLPLFLFAVIFGMGIQESLQLLIAPYTYDISRGVGRVAARWVSIGLLGTQIVLVAMVYSIPRLSNIAIRRLLWSTGVLLVFIYFSVMLLGYISTGIH